MAMLVAVSNSSCGVQPLTCRLSTLLGSGFSLVHHSLSSPILSIYSFSFLLTLVSKYSNINYGTTSHSYSLQQFWFPCLDLSITLDHNIHQNLHFLIFNNTFLSMFILFFTSFQVVSSTQFPINYSCNIILPFVPTFHSRSQ